MLELPVRLLHPDARPPARAYEGDAGFDLVSVEAAELGPGERASLGCGIAIELPEGTCGLVLPRSGLARDHGVTVVNSPGLDRQRLSRRAARDAASTPIARPASRSSPACASRSCSWSALPQVAVVLRDVLAASARGDQGFGSSGRA